MINVKEHCDLLMLALHEFPSSIIVNDKCQIVFMNESFSRSLGIEPQKVIGSFVSDIIPGTKLPEIVATGRTDDNQLMEVYDHVHKKKKNILCKRIPLFKDGKIVGAAGIVTIEQMSEIERLSKELKELQKVNEEYKRTISNLTKDHVSSADAIVGSSEAINTCRELVETFAPSDLPILLTGETGTGKEVFAKTIHDKSSRKDKPMVKINCAAIPAELLESELFGYETGAFTGAKDKGKIGLFEIANHGTLLLDEIGEMPIELQPKLLRVLQEQSITRIGGTRERKIDVRILASTNKNLQNLIKEGKFREDLYYRINSVEIEIPPLRGHLTDLWSLCNYFINIVNEKYGIHTEGINPDVLSLFAIYNWPGNIRELRHTIERLAYLNPDSMITLKDCDFVLKKIDAEELKSEETELYDPDHSKLLHNRIDNMEAKTIRQALEAARWNKTLAAKKLGINRSVLYKKMKKYHIDY